VTTQPETTVHDPPGTEPSGVLVVDDRTENLFALAAVVEPLGVRITTATSGEAALRCLLRDDFALILLDVRMPGLDGFATASMIKKHPRTAGIPIIFLTAFDEHFEHVQQGYSSGAVDYIVKPFDPWVLRSKVQVFLDLHRKTRQLELQTAQLSAHVEQLRASRAALADAERMAQLGGWEVDVPADRIIGSDQTRRIFGWPLDDPLPPASTILQQLRLPGGIDSSSLLKVEHRLSMEAQLVRLDGDVRRVVINAEPHAEPRVGRRRIVGTIQDVTEQRAARQALSKATRELQHERELVHLLQASMAPPTLPEIAELEVAACYRPADSGLAGGDWYDLIPLPGGDVLLVIGDVAGHGVPAASSMSQIRTALRVTAFNQPDPAAILQEAQRYLASSVTGTFATVLIGRLDPSTGICRLASAGHLPPVCRQGDHAAVAWMPVGPPLGTGIETPYEEATVEVAPGGSLVLYTDGLIERRGELLDDGLARLQQCVGAAAGNSWDLVDHVTRSLCDDSEVTDDIALLVVRRRALSDSFTLSTTANVDQLSSIRASVKRWLVANGVEPPQVADLVLAVGELAANACIHAYPPMSAGPVRLEGKLEGETIRVQVSDDGRWSNRTAVDGGRGLSLIRALGVELSVDTQGPGTTAVITSKVTRAVPTEARS
jgi:serine phosphatase RsbU (regulator of sigma subunit)/CheY-like chemotaxis protein/anti-sigma regulatory factor (Ser/Thr protein kinase)